MTFCARSRSPGWTAIGPPCYSAIGPLARFFAWSVTLALSYVSINIPIITQNSRFVLRTDQVIHPTPQTSPAQQCYHWNDSVHGPNDLQYFLPVTVCPVDCQCPLKRCRMWFRSIVGSCVRARWRAETRAIGCPEYLRVVYLCLEAVWVRRRSEMPGC
jgi:hypothetical protein